MNKCNNKDNITANKKYRTNTVVSPKNDAYGIKQEHGQIQDTTEVELDSLDHLQSTTSDKHQTSAEYRVCVELFGICQNANVPIYLYDDILNWARRANFFIITNTIKKIIQLVKIKP